MAVSVRGRAPWWARLAIAAGSLLLVPATGAAAALTGPAITLDGPLDILLVGIDPRGAHTRPLADTIVVAHIPADRHQVYLFSLPRDLVVRIPAFRRNGTPAQRARINAAMALGSENGRDAKGRPRYDTAQGLDLLARAVSEVTGIREFDAAAVLDFGGFQKMIAAMGGVRMAIDQDVVSEHRKPDGTARDRLPACRDHNDCARPYTGPRKTYPRSVAPVRLRAWEALDFVRQRYGLPRVDYDRQRHQRQLIKSFSQQVRRAAATDPARLRRIIGAVGDSLTFAGGSHDALDWATALKSLKINDVTSVTLPGGPVFENRKYLGERLTPDATRFFTAVDRGRVAEFLFDHPSFVDPTA